MYYVGETIDLEERIVQHNMGFYNLAFTRVTNDWELFHSIECKSRITARKIEAHIKQMKSQKYIKDLKKYPEITLKLIKKYK